MLSAKIPLNSMANMKTNMTADGLFHAVTWGATLVGVALLWATLNRDADVRPSGRGLVGYMLAGWGWFNLVEGVIDHHILEVHHVVERLGQSMWDWLFIGASAVLILIGRVIARERPQLA